jgi:hypothetical protein
MLAKQKVYEPAHLNKKLGVVMHTCGSSYAQASPEQK